MKKMPFLHQVILILITTLGITFDISGQKPGKVNTPDSRSMITSESPEKPAETQLNTASLKLADGKTVKLVLIGDLLPQLFINGRGIHKNELPIHQEVIDKLSREIYDRQEKEAEFLRGEIEKIKRQILTDLVNNGILPAQGDIKSYYLTSRIFMVNEKVQDSSIFSFFCNKYIRSQDVAFYYEKR